MPLDLSTMEARLANASVGKRVMTEFAETKQVESMAKSSSFGEEEVFKLVHKRGSQRVEAMEIEGVGCVLKVTTDTAGRLVESVQLIPGTKLEETLDVDGDVISRKLVKEGVLSNGDPS